MFFGDIITFCIILVYKKKKLAIQIVTEIVLIHIPNLGPVDQIWVYIHIELIF